MAKHYKDTPWWWYVIVLVVSFVLGLVVVVKENITLPAWAYVVSLLLKMVIAPIVSISLLYIDIHPLYREVADGVCTELYPVRLLRQWHRHE